jgi:cyanophycinase
VAASVWPVTVFLVGGGVDSLTSPHPIDPFVAEVAERGAERGRRPSLVVAIVDVCGSGARFLPEYAEVFSRAGEVVPMFLRPGAPVESRPLASADGIVVCGGPAPTYLEALAPLASSIRALVAAGTPYLGFSAGAMVAGREALVGGHRYVGRGVCPEEWSEGLDEITTRPGLGLVDAVVDVHTAQAGTLGRVVALVEAGKSDLAVGIDEDTCLAVPAEGSVRGESELLGSGNVWVVRARVEGAVEITRRTNRTEHR